VIELAWPPRVLHPNARPHFHQKAKAAKAYREVAYWTTKATALVIPQRPVLSITFFPPDRRRRDIDGMLSSIKAGLDGISDALEVDDSLFSLRLSRAEPVKGGRVVITFQTEAQS